MASAWTRDRKVPCVIFFLSLAVNSLAYYLLFSGGLTFSKYRLLASQYLRGTASAERLLDFSPFYLYLTIFVQKILPDPNQVMLWLQLGAVAVSCVLLFELLRSAFCFTVAVVGTVAFTLSRSVILYASMFEPEPFLILFLLACLLCVQRRAHRAAFLAGVFLGLSLLIRLNQLPLLLIVPACFRVAGGNGRGLIHRSLLFLLPCLAALFVLAARNHAVNGAFSPVVMNPGCVFFEGNNPLSNGQNAVYPPMVDNVMDEFSGEPDPAHVVYREFPRRLTGRKLPVVETNSYWAHKAWDYVLDNPLHAGRRFGLKALYFFHNERFHDIATVVSNDIALRKSMIPAVPFGLISAMAIALAGRAQYSQSVQYYALAMQKKPEPSFGEAEILSLFANWTRSDSANTKAQVFRGVILRDFGHYDEALAVFMKLHARDSSMAIVNTHIDWLERARKSY